MRRPLALLALLALLATAAIVVSPAAAQERLTAKQVATALQARKAFAQPGLSPKPDVAALSAVAKETPGFYLVVLRRPVKGAANARASARRVLEALQATDPQATVGLIANGKLNGASLAYPEERIQKAVADTRATAETDPVGTLTSFAAAVSKPNINGDQAAAAGDAGSGSRWWLWAIIALLVGGIVLVVLRIRARSHEQRRRRRGGSVWTAREFHLERLEALAARHATLTGETTQDVEDREALEHLQTAGARLLALRRTLPTLTSPRELRTCAGELDAVEWEILWVEHRLSDHVPPAPIARGFPGLCFFSHVHGLGTEAIELRRPDGTIATVYVSPENRLALERGEAPEVSLVHVGSRMIPWPAAPSWYGAYGWSPDDLPGLEYGGEQIWGIDGPEREEDPLDDEPSQPEAIAQSATREDELGMTGEGHAGGWQPPPAAELTGEGDLDADADRQPPDEPTLGAEPTVDLDADPATAPPAPASDAAFEELDEPAPSGLVDEVDAEDTLAGRPTPGETTLEWDPFDGDQPPPAPRS